MISTCGICGSKFEDEYRSWVCPHDTFPANDGNNNFTVHEGALLENDGSIYDDQYFLHGKKTGKSLYEDYRWLPDLTIPMARSIIRHCTDSRENPSILDFGCARGYLVKAFRWMGYSAWGYDISKWALANADDDVKPFLLSRESQLTRGGFDWIIAKDVLEHVKDINTAADLLRGAARTGIFVVVPLAHIGCTTYDVPEYEKDVTHIHRFPLHWWVGLFSQPGWSVEARYRIPGIKDNYSGYPTGNGFITCRRLPE